MTSPTDTESTRSGKRILLVAVLLTLVAAIPRLYNLGGLGFYMDEETTAFASRSLAETGEPRMPSGMPYYRSLPHLWLNSVSARVFGLDEEFSYRLPAALFGIVTVPLIFLLARPFVGAPIAFLAALLLALSEWHIITSRQARMYVPLLFFYIAFAFTALRWARKDNLAYLALSVVLFVATVSFHRLGVFAAFIPLTALFIKGYAKTPQYKLILFSLIGGVSAYFVGNIFIGGAYQEWKDAYAIVSTDANASKSLMRYLPVASLQTAQGVVGLLLGVWLGVRSAFTDRDIGREFRILARYSLAIAFSVMAAIGHLHGAFLSFLMLLLLYPNSLFYFLQRTWKPLAAITAVAVLAAILTITESGFIAGAKSLLSFPYPNWFTLSTISPGISLLFVSLMLYLATTNKKDHDPGGLILLIISLFPLILVGIFMKWAAARYLIQAYPFILILSAYALYMLANGLTQRIPDINARTAALAVSCLLVLSGVLGGHGIFAAFDAGTVSYGDRLNRAALIFPFYPDHKNPGRYVATHRSANDIVIAEDVLTQRWYAGNIDYWLRMYGSDYGGSFTYRGKDHKLHDIYINSVVTTPEILEVITNNKNQRIWLITSGETYYERNLYLKDDQRQWLEAIEKQYEPVFTGQDEITRVYCLNCEIVH